MRVLELSLRNYRQFEEVDLELPARVLGIFGENGSGKSTLMEAIAFALYGVDAARTKKHEIRTQGILADCRVRLVFEHGGQEYEVRRTLKGKAHTPEAELFVGDLLLASGSTDVDSEVQRLLHMELRVFRASVFAEQKQLDAFSDVTAGKRKEMALRLLGIRPVDDARTAARREARASKQSAEQLTGAVPDLADLEARLKEAKDFAREAREQAKTAAASLKASTGAHRDAKKAFDVSDAARQRVEKIAVALKAATDERDRVTAQRDELAERADRLTADLAGLPAIEEELDASTGSDARLRAAERLAEASAKLANVEAQSAAAPEVDADAALAEQVAAKEEVRAAEKAEADARAKHDHELRQLAAAEERLAKASEADPSQPCPTCGRELGEGFSAYLRHCRDEVATAEERLAAAAGKLKDLGAVRAKAETGLQKSQEIGERVRAEQAERVRLAEQAGSLREEVRVLAEPFEGETPDVAVLRDAVGRAKELGERVAGLRAERKRLEDAARDLAKADAQLADLRRKLAKLAEEAEGLSFGPEEHESVRRALADAEAGLEAARLREREAAEASSNAQLGVVRLEGEITQAKGTAARIDELRSQARHLERVAVLLDGFRDHLVSRVGPELSREAEAVFRELTDHEYDDLKIDEETLSIQIADGEAYHAIERFSGSESDLANLALRVAISSHLSRMSGADVGMMVLDEVLGSLDEERKDLMVQTLGRLSGRFHQLFVITHAERVKDQFPASIEVRKVGRRRSVATLS